MKEDKSIFLKVDCVEPVLRGGGICSGEIYLDGVKVWIGNVGYFFPCDRYTICEPDIVREDAYRQAFALIKELYNMSGKDRFQVCGKMLLGEILKDPIYDDLAKKLDAWKKEKEEIRVRDEVYNKALDTRFVVTKICVPSGGEDPYVNGLKKDGTAIKGLLLCNVEKTGVHVDDLDAYLEV